MSLLFAEFGEFYHRDRPHQGLDNELIQKPPLQKQKKSSPSIDIIRLSDIRCQDRLGALLKSYSRKAA